MERLSRGKFIAIGTLIVAIAVILFLTWPLFFGGSPPVAIAPSVATSTAMSSTTVASTPAATASVHLLIVAGTSTIMDDIVSDLSQGENAFALLKNETAKDRVLFIYKTYPGMGDLITQIGGFTNGSGENYWQYTVNGRYVPVGADDYVLQPGDSVVWKFTTSQE